MFTGLVEAQGILADKRPKGGDLSIKVQSSALDFSDVSLGDSIATDGVCLTVTGLETDAFWADVSNETLSLSTFANKAIGANLNLEKAMLPTTRFGGHMVSGHIDGIATINSIHRDARSIVLGVLPPPSLLRYIVHKGSVTIDGVSLTVNRVESSTFYLNIVPHTAQKTKLADYVVGDELNIEVDLIARYLERLVIKDDNQPSKGVTIDMLADAGFVKR